MDVQALPYTVYLLLFQAGCGHLFVTLALDARGNTPRGFVRLGASIAIICLGLAVWLAFALEFVTPVGDYEIHDGLATAVRGLTIAAAALGLAYTVAAWKGQSAGGLVTGALASLVAAAALVMTAVLFSPPTWGAPGVAVVLIAGSLTLGVVNMAMSLGHWYLVTPRLSPRPLEELTIVMGAVLLVEAALVAINLAVPGAVAPATDLPIGENPAFWLRIVIGLVFPAVLAYMSWRSAKEGGMMSATGLLYIAVGAVLVGEVLARALLLATGIAV